MTDEERRTTLLALRDALLARLSDLDPTTKEFNQALSNYHYLDTLAANVCVDPAPTEDGPAEEPYTEPGAKQTPIEDGPAEEPWEKPYTEDPSFKAKQAAALNVENATPELTKVEVRAKLLAHRKKGLNITALLQEFNCSSFNDVTADKYAALLERADELAKELS